MGYFDEPDYYLVVIIGNRNPDATWYVDEESRDAAAIEHYQDDVKKTKKLFKLNIENGYPEMSAYPKNFFKVKRDTNGHKTNDSYHRSEK